MIKIGIIGHKIVPSYNGGIEAVLTETIPLVDKNKFELTIYNRWTTFYRPSEWFKKETFAGCKVVRIPTFKKSFLNAFVYSLLASIHAMFCRYDIVHYHAEGPSATCFLPKITGKKIIATNHGLDWARGKWGGFASKYLKFGEKMSVKISDKLIVLSDVIANYFKKTYGKDTVKICNGIHTNDNIEANIITQKFNLQSQEYFLAVGRLVEEKGFHYLIDAYNSMVTDKKLVIAGELTNSDYCVLLQNLTQDNPNIVFTNFVDGRVKQELFSNCYAYVIPSDLEGMSISLLEALSYGCNVIASDIAENKNIADQYITFFEHGSIVSLIETMKSLKDNTEKEAQISFIKENYSWSKIVNNLEFLYEQVVNS